MARFILSSFADEAADDLKEQLRISAENGIRFIEMRNVNGKGLVDLDLEKVREIKAELDARNFRLSAIGSPFGKINIRDDFFPHLEKFKHCLEIARILETRFIRIFSFYLPEGEDPSVFRDEVMERLDRFVEESRDSGVVCCHENEKGIYGNVPERCLDILKTFDGKIKGVFDPANFIQEKQRVLPAYEMLESYIEYLHIKDAFLADGSVTPSGRGDGDVQEILRRFAQKTGYRYLTVEPHLAVFKGSEKLEHKGVSFAGNGYAYSSNEEAYGTAVNALKELLKNNGYQTAESGGCEVWTK
jgi:sugar phosphate isomerase/epimerase